MTDNDSEIERLESEISELRYKIEIDREKIYSLGWQIEDLEEDLDRYSGKRDKLQLMLLELKYV